MMAENEQEAEPADDLTAAISACIVQADAAGLFLVAAHLDTALSTLNGTGLMPLDGKKGRYLH